MRLAGKLVGQFAEAAVDSDVHGQAARQSAHQLRDRLSGKNTGGPHPERQDHGQGGVDDGFTQQGEKDCLLRAAQTDKDALTGHLQGHEDEQAEIDPQGRDTGLHDLRIAIENLDQRAGEQHGHDPEEGSTGHGYGKVKADAGAHPGVFPGAV